jgi:hypothetical protein
MARINRALAGEGQQLLKARGGPARRDALGPYYLIQIRDGGIVRHGIVLHEFALQRGHLKPFERLED